MSGLLTGVLAPLLAFLTVFLVDIATGRHLGILVALVIAGIALAYGVMAGILAIYDLKGPQGWVELIVDTTWSLPNTIGGFVVGSILFPFAGKPSRSASKGQGWISYAARGSGTYGNRFLQTLGPLNLGGPGQHERMHLLQARILGPVLIPLQIVNYLATFLIQVVWTFTIGGVLYLTKVRPKPYFRPPARSTIQGFIGWVYYATFCELWAYAAGNP